MSLDYLRKNIEAAFWNLALHDINATLEQHGLSCALIGLPVPTGNVIDDEREEYEQRISSLNREQLVSFQSITRAIGNNNENDRYFLDGPVGSVKTFLYQTLLSFIRLPRRRHCTSIRHNWHSSNTAERWKNCS
ncbi:hypothetical protein AVEN_105796-1 [Araneus ventricosus]|uniref:ATP-dependent DNA helicase n=1 Tax=Araneus ventricosus TaxID=182803 RepID=A0A4Y2PUU3_ARAVE|nr:hypothetical protein AVEN_105796-1 [Araneus ventricosus]